MGEIFNSLRVKFGKYVMGNTVVIQRFLKASSKLSQTGRATSIQVPCDFNCKAEETFVCEEKKIFKGN